MFTLPRWETQSARQEGQFIHSCPRLLNRLRFLIAMNLSNESFSTLRAAHLLSIAVSAASLILLFAPFETDFREALNEARVLKELSTSGFQKYAHDALGLAMASPEFLPRSSRGSVYVGAQLVFFMKNKMCCLSPEPANDWSVTPALAYDPPPLGRPLQDWLTWINLKTPARYWSPECDDDTDCTPADLRALSFFSVRPDNPRMSGERWYRFRAFFDRALQRKPPAPWWQGLEDAPSSKFEEKALLESLNREKRSVIEGFVRASSDMGERVLPPISAWITHAPSTRALFGSPSRPDELGMPNLREHWSVLATKPLDEAIAFMEQEQRRVRDVSLFGVSVPGSLCLVAIPLAFAVSHLYLLLNLSSCIDAVTTMKEAPNDHFPWIGLYGEPLARVVTSWSITLIPALLTALLILRYHGRLGLSSSLPAGLLAVTALGLGWQASRSTAKFRACLSALRVRQGDGRDSANNLTID